MVPPLGIGQAVLEANRREDLAMTYEARKNLTAAQERVGASGRRLPRRAVWMVEIPGRPTVPADRRLTFHALAKPPHLG